MSRRETIDWRPSNYIAKNSWKYYGMYSQNTGAAMKTIRSAPLEWPHSGGVFVASVSNIGPRVGK
jgi:hypothetical protein